MPGNAEQAPIYTHNQGQAFFDKILDFEMPTQADWVNWLPTVHGAVAVLIFLCGIACLLQGWKVFKSIVVVNAAVIGGYLGYLSGELIRGGNMTVLCTVAFTALFAVLAWPAMKLGVSIMGALAGAFLGFGVWMYVARMADNSSMSSNAWAGGLLGFVTMGLMAFVVFKLVVTVFTSVQGSLMMVSGALAILMKAAPIHDKLHDPLMNNIHLVVMLVAVPAVIGFSFQYAAIAKKAKKKKQQKEQSS